MEKSGIKVYMCFHCHKLLTEFRVKTGQGCRCGSLHLRPAYPTKIVDKIKLMLEVWRYKCL